MYANQAENDVYMLTKAMIEGYDAYKDGAPGATGMAVKRQTKNWSVPVHKGAVRALKEAGAWSDDQEKFNNNLYRRQEETIQALREEVASAGGIVNLLGVAPQLWTELADSYKTNMTLDEIISLGLLALEIPCLLYTSRCV